MSSDMRTVGLKEIYARLGLLPFVPVIAIFCPFCEKEKLLVAGEGEECCGIAHERPPCKKFDEIPDPADFMAACLMRLSN
jgi:hypothetical protein